MKVKFRFKKHTLASVVTGVLLGAAAISPALAYLSVETSAVKGQAPTVTQGKILYKDINSNSVIDGGDELTANLSQPDGDAFEFNDVDNDPPLTDPARNIIAGLSFQWMRDGVSIVGATNDSYTLDVNDIGKTITVEVKPHTDPINTDPYDGIAVVSSNSISTATSGTVTSVAITGNPLVGSELTADVTCAGGTCTPANLTYQWMIEGRDAVTGDGNGIYANIDGENKSTYMVTKDNQKLKVKVDVTNKP
ncbi:ZirU family protein [Serratia sp. N21D137]|uniref:ZirU family protein n=1 Tax=Serratia sp. N21D137 TaxID=3397495 RepID=UPI0039E1A89B